jgi:hypothetical protein
MELAGPVRRSNTGWHSLKPEKGSMLYDRINIIKRCCTL